MALMSHDLDFSPTLLLDIESNPQASHELDFSCTLLSFSPRRFVQPAAAETDILVPESKPNTWVWV